MTYLVPFIRPSYYFQQDNHPECVQLLRMIYSLTPAGAEGGEGMIHYSLQVYPAGHKSCKYLREGRG